MSPSLAVLQDGRKFMWDGVSYASPEDASAARARYEQDRFEVRVLAQDGAFLVYTRRPVTGAPDAAP